MVDQSECSSHCGKGTVTRRYKCRIRMLNQNIYTDDKHCVRKFGKPRLVGPCDGKCELTHWDYQPWSEVSCSVLSCYDLRFSKSCLMLEHHVYFEMMIIFSMCSLISCFALSSEAVAIFGHTYVVMSCSIGS